MMFFSSPLTLESFNDTMNTGVHFPGKFQTDVGKSWAAEVLSRRNSRLTNRHNWWSSLGTSSFIVHPTHNTQVKKVGICVS